MNTYRIQRSTSVDTVETISDYVIRHLDPDGIYRCIGTGSKEECIAIAERCEQDKAANVRCLYDAKKLIGYEYTF